MTDYRLTTDQLQDLRAAHRKASNVREAYRINAVILLAEGFSPSEVAEALLMDPDTARSYFKNYRRGGLEQLMRMNYVGSEALLNEAQLAELDKHLQDHIYQTAEGVRSWVKEHLGVTFSLSGMTAVLHRLGYRYKKPKLVPGKPDEDKQKAFVEDYKALKENLQDQDVIIFMDAVHPHHNPVLAGGWIKRGKRGYVKSNTGRQRLNINGALNVADLKATVRFEDTINAETTIDLLRDVERQYPKASVITIFCDNAGYYKAKKVSDYLKTSKIELVPLPPYSPNLNLIERFWKFFKRKILYNTYYETFAEYEDACSEFFNNLEKHRDGLRSLLTDNFEIVPSI
ncbi:MULTISPECIES: IS630 family transposase [Thiorhodovibrio]|uniref:IS630 family transposase n=1 Tax=Thiorhodovibrio TaxID=61593 RepID=UPI001911B9EE|nr:MULTISPECIES: IS630 family transposase [Thiorhodovibrio]MBK5970767.1 IS630 family transposase [Thiorhodovibrio winogradskyi]WPL10844.1 Transposase [Thiorhodovibrio litoralis]